VSGYGIATDPRSYSARETLRDGTVIEIRAIRPDDKSRLLEHFRSLSVGSSYVRFFNPKQKFSERELAAFTELDFIRRVALVATVAGASADRARAGRGTGLLSHPEESNCVDRSTHVTTSRRRSSTAGACRLRSR